MPECPYCCLSASDDEIEQHVAALHLDDGGQVIANSVVDKIAIRRLIEVVGRTATVTIGAGFTDSHTMAAHLLLTKYLRLVVYRAPVAMGQHEGVLQLYAFERTSQSAYGDPPAGYELVWVAGEWSLSALGNTLVRV